MSAVLLFNLCFGGAKRGGTFASRVFVGSMTQGDYEAKISGSLLLGCQQNQIRCLRSVGASRPDQEFK